MLIENTSFIELEYVRLPGTHQLFNVARVVGGPLLFLSLS